VTFLGLWGGETPPPFVLPEPSPLSRACCSRANRREKEEKKKKEKKKKEKGRREARPEKRLRLAQLGAAEDVQQLQQQPQPVLAQQQPQPVLEELPYATVRGGGVQSLTTC
jgi:hypothetical protein